MKQLAILSLCALMFIGVVTVCGAQELVLHLPLDELSGDVAADVSEFGNDATFKGKPELIDGVFGKAVAFDGKNLCANPRPR